MRNTKIGHIFGHKKFLSDVRFLRRKSLNSEPCRWWQIGELRVSVSGSCQHVSCLRSWPSAHARAEDYCTTKKKKKTRGSARCSMQSAIVQREWSLPVYIYGITHHTIPLHYIYTRYCSLHSICMYPTGSTPWPSCTSTSVFCSSVASLPLYWILQ
jgi:hypothetical protein